MANELSIISLLGTLEQIKILSNFICVSSLIAAYILGFYNNYFLMMYLLGIGAASLRLMDIL